MAVSTGGNPIKILESPGKMELVGIADLPADLAHRKICDLEKFGSFFHTVLDKKFLWRLSEDITENLAKITPIQIAAASHVLDRDRTGIILGDEGHSFVRVKLCTFASLGVPPGRRSADQCIHDKIKMPDQMIGRFLSVCGKIQNLIFEPLPILWCAWKIDRRVRRKTGALQNLLCPESAEFDPGIFHGSLRSAK